MMTKQSKLPFVVTAIGSLALAPAAFAQTVDTSDWACEYCPFQEGHEGDYEVGATSVSDDSAYFGNATGYDEEGVYANLDGQGSHAGENHRARWYFEDLALDSRVAELEGGWPGKFDYNVGWREIPYRKFITTSTVFNQAGGATLGLPQGWVNAATTGGMTELNSSLVSRPIESDRAILDIGGRYRPSARWSFFADYRRQEKDGLKMYGGSTFTNASILPMPFEYATDEVDIGVRYASSNSFVSLSWYLSEFENENLSTQWQNPFEPSPGAENLALAQAPDNEFMQVSLAAGYTMPEYRTVISVSGSMGEIKQDAMFLPYTINPNVTTTPLPRTSLDGSIDTTRFSISLTSRFLENGRFDVSYRYDERDNSTVQDTWNRVITDQIISGDLEQNIPYSFERTYFSVSGDYDLFDDSIRLSAGYDRREMDRDFQEVASQDEDTGWGRVRWRPARSLEFDVRGGTSKRDVDVYNEGIADVFGQNPLMRKYNLAYRYREFADLTFTWSPLEAPVSVSINGLWADDSYSRSELGLLSGEELSLSADVSWSFTETGSLYVNVGSDSIESVQAGSEFFDNPDWLATNEDEFTTIGAGLRLAQIGERFDLQLDYTRSEGETDILIDSAAGLPDQFPTLKNEIDYLRLNLGFRQSERIGWNFSVSYQQFEAQDWALEGVAPDAIPNVLSLGALPYDEDALWVGVGFRYSM